MASITPRLLAHHERNFGPYPFPESRLAIVETLSSSSANATWIGVGSRMLDFTEPEQAVPFSSNKAAHILVHELGHAWWGHGVHVGSWRDNWLHESFASYGTLLFVGDLEGEDAMDRAFQQIAGDVSFKHRLALCDKASACSATSISTALWYKGPWVLRTLRSQIHNDAQWLAALSDFQQSYRFQSITTEDFSRVLGEHTGRSWDRFFEEWFESSGLPCIVGNVRIASDRILVDLENRKDRILTRGPDKEGRNFHLALRLQWKEGLVAHERRLELAPGDNSWSIDCDAEPTDVKLLGLESILGPHEVKILPLPHSGLGRR
jgi:aminopeptidase N